MDPQDILDSLLNLLPLSVETIKFIRQLFQEILNFFGIVSTNRRTRYPTTINLEDTAAKLREVIEFFNSPEADAERDEFLVIFPKWEAKREENIDKLFEIAESIQESRQNCSIAQIVSGSVGLVGGAAFIGSILFPPAAPALLPAWLGGAAATALVPSFLLPAAATAVTSSLAVGGTIAAGASGVAQVVTSVTEAALLSNQIDNAKNICCQDKKNFDRMMRWFERTDRLKSALKDLFEVDILDIIFRDLKDYFGDFNFASMAFRCALKRCCGNILGTGLSNMSFHIAVTAVILAVFLAHRRNRFLFQSLILTHRFGFGLLAALNATPQLGRLVASTVMKEGELIPRAVASKVAVGFLTGIGMVLDVTNIVLNSIDLAEGSKSETQEKVLEVAKELQANLYSMREVYKEVWNAFKKTSEDFLNSLIVDELEMMGPVNKNAHEVYQDVLKEMRELRISANVSDRRGKKKQMNQSFDEMENCARSLRKLIDFFNDGDKARLSFVRAFNQWEKKRSDNIANLNLIAKCLQETKQLCSSPQSVGFSGGATTIGAGPLQYCCRVISSAIATCKTAINVFNLRRLVVQTHKRSEETRRICRQDREDLSKMEVWFRLTQEVSSAFHQLFGKETFDAISEDLKGLYGPRSYPSNQSALKNCVAKVFRSRHQLHQSLQEAALAVVVASLLLRQCKRNFKCFDVTQSSDVYIFGFGKFGRASNEFTIHTDNEELFLQTLQTDSPEGKIGFVDTINAARKLAEIDEFEILTLAKILQRELDDMTQFSKLLPSYTLCW